MKPTSISEAIDAGFKGQVLVHRMNEGVKSVAELRLLFEADEAVERSFGETFDEGAPVCEACCEPVESVDEECICAECREHFDNEDAMRDEEARQLAEYEEDDSDV